MSLTGKYANYSRDILHALNMFRDWANEERAGVEVMSKRARIEFYFEDDGSQVQSARELYHHMTRSNTSSCLDLHSPCIRTNESASWTPDFYLAPFGKQLTLAALNATESASKVMISYSTAFLEELPQAQYFFEVLIPASTYLYPVLNSLMLQGAQSVAVVYSADPQSEHLCGSVQPLTQLHVNDFGSVGSNKSISQALASIIPANPDILVGCFTASDCDSFFEIAQISQLDPRAILTPNCKSTERHGVYSITRDVKDSAGLDGKTPAQWAELYATRAVTSAETIEYVQAAYSSGVLAVAALEKINSLETLDLAYHLTRVKVETVYGRIELVSDGRNMAPVTISQVQGGNSSSISLAEVVYPVDSTLCSNTPLKYQIEECVSEGMFGSQRVSFSFTRDCTGDQTSPAEALMDCSYLVATSVIGILVNAWNGICALICFWLLLRVIANRHAPILQMTPHWYLVSIATLGTFICANNSIRNGPDNDTACVLRPILEYGSVYSLNTLVIAHLFILMKTSMCTISVKDFKVSSKELGEAVLWISAFPAVFLFLWIVIDTPRPTSVEMEFANVKFSREVCASFSNDYRMILEGFRGTSLFLGIFISRDIGKRFPFVKYYTGERVIVVNIFLLTVTKMVSMFAVPPLVFLALASFIESFCATLSVAALTLPKLSLVHLPQAMVDSIYRRDLQGARESLAQTVKDTHKVSIFHKAPTKDGQYKVDEKSVLKHEDSQQTNQAFNAHQAKATVHPDEAIPTASS